MTVQVTGTVNSLRLRASARGNCGLGHSAPPRLCERNCGLGPFRAFAPLREESKRENHGGLLSCGQLGVSRREGEREFKKSSRRDGLVCYPVVEAAIRSLTISPII